MTRNENLAAIAVIDARIARANIQMANIKCNDSSASKGAVDEAIEHLKVAREELKKLHLS